MFIVSIPEIFQNDLSITSHIFLFGNQLVSFTCRIMARANLCFIIYIRLYTYTNHLKKKKPFSLSFTMVSHFPYRTGIIYFIFILLRIAYITAAVIRQQEHFIDCIDILLLMFLVFTVGYLKSGSCTTQVSLFQPATTHVTGKTPFPRATLVDAAHPRDIQQHNLTLSHQRTAV